MSREHKQEESTMTALTSQQTRQLERTLLAQRSAAVGIAREELSRASENSYAAIAGEVPDFGDQATATSLTDFDNELARRHSESIRDIDDALLRVRAREVGRCDECGADIGFERLMAFPTARRCVACQRQHERTYAVAATPTL
jgi:RNA polymerase-binding transcription factor DksA